MTQDLSKVLANAVLPLLLADVEERVTATLAKLEAERVAPVRELVIRNGADAPAVNVGRQHARFETLLHAVAAKVPVWLAGPAGSGKTVAAEYVARALGTTFGAMSIGPQTTQAHLFGYMDATGTYRPTIVRTLFEGGGTLLLDEIDRGNPGVLTALNALLANQVCAFPDGMIVRHPDFRIIAAANTIGMGADRQYVGALQLDAATLDRFALIDWPYDDAFERELAEAAGGRDGASWCAVVQSYRAAASELKIRHVISPRATLHGIKLAHAGMAWDTVAAMTVWRGLDDASRDRIIAHADAPSLPTANGNGGFQPIGDRNALPPADNADDADPEEPAPVSNGPCPRCGNTRATIVSRYNLGHYACWTKRGGCGFSWPMNASA